MSPQDLAVRTPVADLQQMAKAVVASRMFGMDEAQAFVLMCLCESEGLHPIQAVRRYDIIQGRPAMKAAAILADFQAAGGICKWKETTATRASAVFSHPRLCPDGLEVVYTIKDAEAAGLANKDNYKKNPGDMLVARVISRGVRRVMPGVITGIHCAEEAQDYEPPLQPTTARVIDITDAPVETRESINAMFPHNGAAKSEPEDWSACAAERAAEWNYAWEKECGEHGIRLTSNMSRPMNKLNLSILTATEILDSGAIEAERPADIDGKWASRFLGDAYANAEQRQIVLDATVNVLARKLEDARRAVNSPLATELVGVGTRDPGEEG